MADAHAIYICTPMVDTHNPASNFFFFLTFQGYEIKCILEVTMIYNYREQRLTQLSYKRHEEGRKEI